MVDVTCVGILVADIVGKPVEALPERGKMTLVDQLELHTGGCAANTGIDLRILGVDTAIVGKVGNDGLGDFIESRFVQKGIHIGGICRDAVASTSATMVLVDRGGERSFLHCYGANATLCLEDLDIPQILDSRIVHVAGSLIMPAFDGEPTTELLKQAKKAGCTTSLDTVWDPKGLWMQKIGSNLPYVDYFLPNYEEAKMLAGGREDPQDLAQFLLDAGVQKVVGIKLGEKGCYIRTSEGDSLSLPALKVDAIDALGAGDAFVAGFLAGLIYNWDVETCARFATAVGACCVQALGATTGIKRFEETLAMI